MRFHFVLLCCNVFCSTVIGQLLFKGRISLGSSMDGLKTELWIVTQINGRFISCNIVHVVIMLY